MVLTTVKCLSQEDKWNHCGWWFKDRLDKSGRINTLFFVSPDKEVDQMISSRCLCEADFF